MPEFQSLPAQPRRRRVIWVLDPLHTDQIDLEDAREIARRPELAILESGAQEYTDALVRSLDRAGLIQAGNVLLQSPFSENYYELVDNASRAFALEKYTLLSHLAQLLGAVSVTVDAIENTRTGERTEIQADGTLVGRGVKTNVRSDSTADLSRAFRLFDEFPGSDPDIELARAFLEDHALSQDGELANLIRSRDVPHNRMEHRTLTVDLSSESQRTLDVAASISVPKFANIKTDVKRIASQAERLKVTYTIRFTASGSKGTSRKPRG